jgi:hypothetical protein
MAETVHIRHADNPRSRVREIVTEAWPAHRMQGFVQVTRDPDAYGGWRPTVRGVFTGPPSELAGAVAEDEGDPEQWSDEEIAAKAKPVPARPKPAGEVSP